MRLLVKWLDYLKFYMYVYIGYWVRDDIWDLFQNVYTNSSVWHKHRHNKHYNF